MEVRASFLEIHNEELKDLLAPPLPAFGHPRKQAVSIREDSTGGIYFAGEGGRMGSLVKANRDEEGGREGGRKEVCVRVSGGGLRRGGREGRREEGGERQREGLGRTWTAARAEGIRQEQGGRKKLEENGGGGG